jgi:hypothetical protein
MLDQYREIVLLDFEFGNTPGNRPEPVCCVAHELRSGRWHYIWQDQFGPLPPWPIGRDVLTIAYFASAELGCYKVLGWPMPERILDLYVEFRNKTNGFYTPEGAKLLGALTHFGLDSMGATEKEEMRALVLRGGPWTAEERAAILAYCGEDVAALVRLLPAMIPHIDLPRALLRGRYMAAVATMEHTGTPIDTEMLALLRGRWTDIQDQLIADIDVSYGVFDGRTFKHDRFAALLIQTGIPWPRLDTGRLDLSDEAFRQMAKSYPAVSPLRELRSALSDMRLNDLAVGHDGRNRCLLSPFRARTSRNQPSNTKFIFGPSVWLRGLVKPPPGYGIAYVDWSQQEFGIAAALSGDSAMLAAYESGDPYLAFAKQAGAVPPDTVRPPEDERKDHPTEAIRELYKQCVLGVQYGMGAYSLALRIAQPPIVARDLLRAHRETYPRFWTWSDAAVDTAILSGKLHTTFGWQVHVSDVTNPRSLRNFPMQSNGAEMLRIACILATERGVEVCAPVHDAVLICAPLERFEEDIARMRAAMAEASRKVLDGFELGTAATKVRWPDRYMDKRGVIMWERVLKFILKAEEAVA